MEAMGSRWVAFVTVGTCVCTVAGVFVLSLAPGLYALTWVGVFAAALAVLAALSARARRQARRGFQESRAHIAKSPHPRRTRDVATPERDVARAEP
jgi:uncharacterized membrane protein YfcA